MSKTILENVPASLRGTIGGDAASIISAVVPQFAEGMTVDETIHFISGAIRHQGRITVNKDGQPLGDKSNSFKATITSVERFERRGERNFLVGRKAKINFKAKGSGGDLEDQSIDTEWVEYFAGRAEEEVFSIALARTLEDIAKDNIGKEVYLTKGFITGVTTSKGGSSVRFLANITPANTEGGDGGNSSGGEERSKPLASKSDIDAFVRDIEDDDKAAKLFDKLSAEDQKEIPGIIVRGLAAGSPVGYIKKSLSGIDIKVDDAALEDIVNDYKKDKEAIFDLFDLIAKAAIS
jgi:hypothetical protein